MTLNLKKIAFSLFLLLTFTIQLGAKENPVADPQAIVVSGNMRFTVLTPEMIRIEWSDTKEFEDRASFIVVNRHLPVPAYTTDTKDGYLYIKTEKMELKYKIGSEPVTNPASSQNLKISFNTNGVSDYWYPEKKDPFNLKGTSRTLDHSSGDNMRAVMEDGILSRSGWTLIDESKPNGDTSKSLLFENKGGDFDWVAERKPGNTIDWYFMAYGHNYKKALLDYTKVGGKIPMPPLYSFGYWYSKYERYTEQDFKNIVNEIQQHDIPIDVMVVDMDWHYAGHPEDGGRGGWTGWSWNKSLIPDPQKFIEWMHQKNLKVTLNLHPADGVATHEDNFEALANDLGLPTDKTVKWNLENEKFYKYFFKNIMRPHENIGVDFWWLDWQQWLLAPDVKDLGNTFWINHVYYNDMRINRPERRSMIFHRWGGLGNHRYPIGFSGDSWATFPTLAFQVYYNTTASNVGYGYWSHDLGGHNQAGPNDPELYLRWIQFGVFSPITRTHATNAPHIDRRIWKYSNFSLMRDALKLRYALIPYIYTYSRQAYDTGVSLCRPLYYDFPEENEAYKQETTYMFGDEIFVSPIVTPSETEIGTSTKQIWLPEGRWFEAKTGATFEGNQKYQRSFAHNEIPFYYKEGAVIPMYPEIKHLKKRPDTLIVQFVPGKLGSFSYYEDEGDNEKYRENKYTITKIAQETDAQQGKYTVYPREGAFDNMPGTRKYEFRLLSKLPAKQVVVDGKEYSYSSQAKEGYWTYDSELLAIKINIPSKSCNKKIEVSVKYNEKQAASEDLIAGKIGQMSRIIQCNDSLKLKIGNNMPALFTNLVGTRDRIAKNPQQALTELQDFEKQIEEAFELLLKVENAPKKEIKEWKDFVLLGKNTSQLDLGESEKNTVPGYNQDGSRLWITGTAIPGGTAILTEDPIQIAGYLRYHGKLEAGEFKIMNTPEIQVNTKFYVPSSKEVTNAVGNSFIQETSNASVAGWSVTIPDDYYKIKVNAINNTLNGEIFAARNDLFIVGGATEAGWNSGQAIRLKKDLNNPNLFIFSGTLKETEFGDDRNMFKLLGQNDWGPVSFHSKTQKESLLESKYIFENLPGDHKWAIDLTKQGGYIIKVDLLEETISAKQTNLSALYINGEEWKNMDEAYVLDCSNSDSPVDIKIVPLPDAIVDIGTSVEFKADKPGLNTLDFTISSKNGVNKESYKLKIIKPFAFYDLVSQMWNNTLTVNNNPLKNGGYKFIDFKWYEDGRTVGTNKQYYSAGKSSTDLLSNNAVYMVKLTDENGYNYETCPTKLTFETLNQILIYPNPVKAGETVNIKTGSNTAQSADKAKLKVYDINGNVVCNKTIIEDTTSFETTIPGFYLIQLISKDYAHTAKLLVK